LTDAVASRVDRVVDFHFGRKAPVAGITNDLFSIDWSGTITPRKTALYTFITKADDGVVLSVDGQTLIDDWTNPQHKVNRGKIELPKGQTYAIELDYHHEHGSASIELLWSRRGQGTAMVPAKVLKPISSGEPDAGDSNTGNTGDSTMPIAVPVYTPPPMVVTIPTAGAPIPAAPPTTGPGNVVNAPPAITAPATAPAGNTYTVDPNGVLNTIGAAAKLAQPGDTVVILPGTYHESINLTTSGTATAPITFEAQTPGTVTIDATGFTSAFTSNFGNTDYIIVKGINVKNCANADPTLPAAVTTGNGWVLQDMVVDGADGTGIDVIGSNVTLLRVTAQNCGRAGLSGDGCTNVTVTDCVTTGNNTRQNDPSNNGGAGKWTRTDHVTIENLNSYNNTGPGLWFDYNNTNVVIKDSKIHDNHGLNHDYEGIGLNMELDPGPVLVQNDQFYGNTGSNICVQSSRNVTIQGNSLKGTALEFRDWPRGDNYTDQSFNIFSNTFDDTTILTDGGTWGLTSPTVKQITFAGNTYANTPAVEFIWGSTQYSLTDGEAKLGFEATPPPSP